MNIESQILHGSVEVYASPEVAEDGSFGQPLTVCVEEPKRLREGNRENPQTSLLWERVSRPSRA